MHNFVKALSLAVALSAVSAAEAHAQFSARIPGGTSSSSVYRGGQGSRNGTYGSTSIDRQLQPYLDGITITRGQDVTIERAWEYNGSFDQRLDNVRRVLTSTQQRRFDRNRDAIAYGSNQGNQGYGYGTYGQGSRSSTGSNGGYGNGNGGSYDRQREAAREQAQREAVQREAARRDEVAREQQRTSAQRSNERARSQQGQQRGNSASHRRDGDKRRDQQNDN